MAQQSYKKFVASAATATLVASAIVPVASANVTTAAFTDVPASYKDAVDFVVTNNISAGLTATSYGINSQIKRVDAAAMIAAAAGLMDQDAPASGFSDVPARAAVAVNSLKAAGVVSGKTTTKFGAQDNITRGEAAIMLQKAFDLKSGDKKNSFTDVSSRYDEAVDALVANDVTKGINATQFGTQNNIKRGDFAKFLYALEDQIVLPGAAVETVTVVDETTTTVKLKEATKELTAKDFKVLVNGTEVVPTKVVSDEKGEVYTITHASLAGTSGVVSVNGKQADFDFVVTELNVEKVEAVNATTIKLTGQGLKPLKAEDITVAGNGVSAVAVAADGKSATVTLTGVLAPNKDTKVTIKADGKTKEFTVNYAFSVPEVAVESGVYDDDTAGQRLTVYVKGEKVSVDYLNTAGYTVEFRAFNASNANVSSTLFENVEAGNYSKDGLLKTNKTIGKYKVQLVLKKGSEVATSDYAEVEIRNLDNSATVSEDYEILTSTGIAVTDTLVVGETAMFDSLYVGNGDTVTEVNLDDKNAYSVKSSNPSVISVDPDQRNGFKAVGLGTAKVTVTVGNAVKEVTINVKGEPRKATTVTGPNVLEPIVGLNGNKSFTLSVLDQYGNGVVGAASKIDATYPTSVDNSGNSTIVDNGVGYITLTVPATKGGQTGTIVFKARGTDDVLGTTTIKTTSVNNRDITKLIPNRSDETIRSNDDRYKSLTYKLRSYNSEGILQGNFQAADYNGYTVKFNEKVVSVEQAGNANPSTAGELVLTGSDDKLVVKGKAAGSTKLSIYDRQGALVAETTVTVAQAEATITGVNWKSSSLVNYKEKRVTYKDVLNITEASAGSDDIVNGLTFSSPVVNKVRIFVDVNGDGKLYLDKNDNGKYDSKDVVLATLTASVAPDQMYLTSGDLNVGTGLVNGTTPITDGSKGLIAFKLTQEPTKTVVATTNVQVDVMPSDAQKAEAQNLADLQATINNAANGATINASAKLPVNTVVNVSKPLTINFGANNPTVHANVTAAGNTTVTGTLAKVTVNNPAAHVVLTGATVGTVDVIEGATSSVVIDAGSAVNNLIVKDRTGIKVENNGTIRNMEIAGAGNVVLVGANFPEIQVTAAAVITAPKNTVLVAKADATINSQQVKAGEIATVDNSGATKVESQALKNAVEQEALKITSLSLNEAGNKIDLSAVTALLKDGYTVAIKSSSNEAVITKENTVKNDSYESQTVNVKLNVKHTASGLVAETKTLSVTVPGKKDVYTVNDSKAVGKYLSNFVMDETNSRQVPTDLATIEGKLKERLVELQNMPADQASTENRDDIASLQKYNVGDVKINSNNISISQDGKTITITGPLFSEAAFKVAKGADTTKYNTPFNITMLSKDNNSDGTTSVPAGDKVAKLQINSKGYVTIEGATIAQ